MNSVNKIILLLILFYSHCLICQELNQQYDYALSLFNDEQYFEAVTEFKRLIFFDSSGTFGYTARYYIGASYKEGGRYSDAIKYFGEASAEAHSRDEEYLSKIEIVKSNILRGTYRQAHNQLNDLERISDKSRINELYYWRGWVYMLDDEWDKAAEYFEKTDKGNELRDISLKVHKDKYSVTTAKVLSYIIPGAGQFYTGNYISGLMSLGWNILWGYITINSFIEDRIFDGFVTGNLLWLRFYSGNIQNAEKFAERENLLIVNKTLRYLQDYYRGEKP